jgi:hypothetical protein
VCNPFVTGTRYLADAELKTGIPFLGKKIEQVATSHLKKAIAAGVEGVKQTLAEQ